MKSGLSSGGRRSIIDSLRSGWLKHFLVPTLASIAQWLEHWSCKPGVESSILSGGYFHFYFYFWSLVMLGICEMSLPN